MAMIEESALKGIAAPAIRSELLLLKGRGFISQVPSVKVIQGVIRSLAGKDPSGPWGLADADTSTPPAILSVLAEVVERTDGRRRHLTREEAQWIARIDTLAPGLSPWNTFRLARAYLAGLAAGKPSEDLDCLAAFAPWQNDERRQRYLAAINLGIVVMHPWHLMDLYVDTSKPLRIRGRDKDSGKWVEAEFYAPQLDPLTKPTPKRRRSSQ
jgi:hypothetical protein